MFRTARRSVLRAVLRLAPCVSSLTLGAPLERRWWDVLALRSVCATRELVLWPTSRRSVMIASAMIRNQVALGRLRILVVNLHRCAVSGNNYPAAPDWEGTSEMESYRHLGRAREMLVWGSPPLHLSRTHQTSVRPRLTRTSPVRARCPVRNFSFDVDSNLDTPVRRIDPKF